MDFIKFNTPKTTGELLGHLKALGINFQYDGETNALIQGVSNGLFRIDETLCFVENITHIQKLEGLEKALILTNTPLSDELTPYSLVSLEDSRLALIRLLDHLGGKEEFMPFSSGNSHSSPFISDKASIHPSAVLEERIVIEDNVTISAGCVIKRGTVIESGSLVRENCVIGCDGIALYKAKNGEVYRFPHVAGVHIGNNVELGAGCVIARGTLSSTTIGAHTVIGNLSNIGHGVRIGTKVWISVGAMIGGNCKIEAEATIGLGVTMKDNLIIAEGSTIGMGSVVTKSLKEKGNVFGNPAKPVRPIRVGPNR